MLFFHSPYSNLYLSLHMESPRWNCHVITPGFLCPLLTVFISDSTLSMAVHYDPSFVCYSLSHSLPTGTSRKEGEEDEERGEERGGGARRRVGGVRWRGGSDRMQERGRIDGDIGSCKTPDTDYYTGHQTPPTTPHPTLTIIPHHLCVVIPLVSIILLVCWLWLYVWLYIVQYNGSM